MEDSIHEIGKSRYPWIADVTISVFFIGAVVVALAPLLFFGRIFSDSDMLSLFYPFFDFYHTALAKGESFLWNPLLFSGYPTYASQSGGFLDPINRIIFSFFGSVEGLHLRLFLDYFLTLLFSYWAGRSYGLSRLAASMIGMGYLVSISIFFLSNPLVANVLFLTPLLLLAFSRFFSGEGTIRWVWIAAGGIGLGISFLSGLAQLVFYAFVLVVAFTAISFFLERRKSFFSSLIPYCGWFAAVISIGIIVGLPQVLPSFFLTPFTLRSEGVSYAIAAGRSIEWGDMLLFFFPNYLYFPHISVGRKALFVGAFLFFMAALAGVMIIKNLRRIIKEARAGDRASLMACASLATFLLAFLIAFERSPFFYIFHHMPVFSLFRYADRWMFVGAFYLVMLGAWGFDMLHYWIRERAVKTAVIVLGGIVSALALLVALLNLFGAPFWNVVARLLHAIFGVVLYGRFGFSKDPAHYYGVVERGVGAWREFLSWRDFSFAFPFSLLIISYLIVAGFLWWHMKEKVFRGFGFGVALLTFLGVFGVYWGYAMIPRAGLESHAAILAKYVPVEDRLLYRTYPFMLEAGFLEVEKPVYRTSREGARAFTEIKFAGGWPNQHFFDATRAMPSVEGYDPFLPRVYFDALVAAGSTFGGQYGTGNFSPEEKIDRLMAHLDVIGMMAGKYIFSGKKLPAPSEISSLTGPEGPLRLLGTETISRYRVPLYIYENSHALPRFYFANTVVAAPGKSLIMLLEEQKRNFQTTTYLDCSPCAREGERMSGGNASLEDIKNDRFRFLITVSAPQWFIVSESNLPGWTARLDDVAASTVKANGLFMAVFIPQGTHRLVFSYEGVIGEAGFLRRIGFMH